MNPILSRAILLLITIFSGCSKGSTKPPTKPNTVQVKTISPNVYFPDATEQKKEYLAKMRTLKKGDKIEDVVQILGHNFSTEPYDLEEIDEAYGTEVTYSIDDFHGHNQYISFWFGKDDQLIRMSTNIAEAIFDPATDINTAGMKPKHLYRLLNQPYSPQEATQPHP
jgi:hypothetical protein